MANGTDLIHPLWVRITHWVNAVAVVIMAMSGWRIYDASPFFPFAIPVEFTLGGWLGGAIQWHFAAMWVLVGNGLIYLGGNVIGGRLRHKFFPWSPRAFLADVLQDYEALELMPRAWHIAHALHRRRRENEDVGFFDGAHRAHDLAGHVLCTERRAAFGPIPEADEHDARI